MPVKKDSERMADAAERQAAAMERLAAAAESAVDSLDDIACRLPFGDNSDALRAIEAAIRAIAPPQKGKAAST